MEGVGLVKMYRSALEKNVDDRAIAAAERFVKRKLSERELTPAPDGIFNADQKALFAKLYPNNGLVACCYLSALLGHTAIGEYHALVAELGL